MQSDCQALSYLIGLTAAEKVDEASLSLLYCVTLYCTVILYAGYNIFSNENKESVKNIIQICFLNGFYVSEIMILIDG